MPPKLLIAACLLSAIAFSAWAVEYPLADPYQEARAYALFHATGCLYCRDQSIADSPTDFAAEVRRRIRERVAAGDSNYAIMDYLTSHFGDAILIPWPPAPVPQNQAAVPK